MKKSITCFAAAISCLLTAADWSGFRGPGGNAVSDVKLPTKIDNAKHIAWKVEMPGRGPSSPIVVGEQVIVTASSGPKQDRLHVASYDAKSGKRQWHRQFWATGRTYTHPTIGVAAPTPASDGERIFAFFSSNDLICLDLAGNLQWYRGLADDWPKAGNDIGMSSSPVVSDGVVVVQIENQADSFALALDASAGEDLWRVKRNPRANWASPSVLPASGKRKAAVLLQSPVGITAHDLRTGDEVWKLEVAFPTITSPLIVEHRAYLPTKGMMAVKFPEDSYSPEVLWESNKLKASAPSPVLHAGRLYAMGGSILTCGDVKTGEVLWKLRVEGRYWATPVVAGGLIYCVNQEGKLHVVKPGDENGEIVSEHEFGEVIQGTPAIGAGAMFVRSDAHLWKVAE